MKTAFAINMIKARQFYQWSQNDIAIAADTGRSNIGAYEEGRATPPFETLVRICEAFAITDVFAFITDHNFDISKQHKTNKSIIELKYRRASKKIKKAIDVLLEM